MEKSQISMLVNSIMTKKDCKSGSERIASICEQLIKRANGINANEDFLEENIIKNTLILNVQGDQPFLDPLLLKKMIDFCFKNKNIPFLTTPIYKLDNKNIHNPNVVKTLWADYEYLKYLCDRVSKEMQVKDCPIQLQIQIRSAHIVP